MKKRETKATLGLKPSYDTEELREKILAIISSKWPASMTEIVREAGLPDEKKSLLRVKYNIDQLAREGKVLIKKIDRAAVCWPAEIEKLRVLHEFLQ